MNSDNSDGMWNGQSFTIGSSGNKIDRSAPFIPEKIIYCGTKTICIFPDGTRIDSQPTKDDNFDEEVGVAMCVIRKVFNTRGAFLTAIENAYRQNQGEGKKSATQLNISFDKANINV